MKQFVTKVLVLSALMVFMLQFTAQAQFASDKSKKSKFIFAMGGGAAAVEMSAYSLLGGNITMELRKPIAFIGQNMTLSGNLTFVSAFGNATENREESFVYMPAGILSINFNAYSQSTIVARNAFGGFLGVGLMVMPEKKVTYTNAGGEELTKSSGSFGPAVLFGPRFRVGKAYMDVRVFGGLTFGGDTEMTYGGFNLMYTFGMNKRGRTGMY